MTYESSLKFLVSIPLDPYLKLSNDGLNQYRGIINFLKQDGLGDLLQIKNSKWSFIQKRKILSQLESWTILKIKEYMDLIDQYIKEGWVDRK